MDHSPELVHTADCGNLRPLPLSPPEKVPCVLDEFQPPNTVRYYDEQHQLLSHMVLDLAINDLWYLFQGLASQALHVHLPWRLATSGSCHFYLGLLTHPHESTLSVAWERTDRRAAGGARLRRSSTHHLFGLGTYIVFLLGHFIRRHLPIIVIPRDKSQSGLASSEQTFNAYDCASVSTSVLLSLNINGYPYETSQDYLANMISVLGIENGNSYPQQGSVFSVV